MVPWRTTTLIGRGRGFSAAALGLVVAALMLVAAGCGGDDASEAEPAAAGGDTPTYGQCEVTGEYDSITLETETPDTLTVGYTSIAPATYDGDTEASVDDGFNYCLAANIAHRAGLPEITLKKVDFAQLIVARESGFDVAIDDFYIKPEREEKVDFSTPYGASWSGVVARSDDIPEQSEFKDQKMGVTLGSAQQVFLDEVLQPTQQYSTYDSPVEMFAALRANQIDLALIDMPVALTASFESDGAIETIAEIRAGGEVGIIMAKGTPNKEPVSAVVQEMLDSGQLNEMEEKYYFAAYGGVDPESLPDWDP